MNCKLRAIALLCCLGASAGARPARDLIDRHR